MQENRVKRAGSTLTLDFLTFMGLSWNFNVLLMRVFGVGIQNVSSRDMMGLKDWNLFTLTGSKKKIQYFRQISSHSKNSVGLFLHK